MKTLTVILLLSTALVAQVRYQTGDYRMTGKATKGKFYHYIEGTVARPSSSTRGLLLIGVGPRHGPVHLGMLSWHHFGMSITNPNDGGMCIAKDGLVSKVGLVSVFWFKDGPDTRMHYLLSWPKWANGVTIRWQAVLDRGKGKFWVSDAFEFTGS